jgi:hypothetical protein
MTTIEQIILNALLSDALAAVFDGYTAGHIKSSYYEEDGIPKMKLNNKEIHKWRKPMLYSSMSQLMILSCLNINKKGDLSSLFNLFEKINHMDVPGIIRYRDRAEDNFINKIPDDTISARLLSQSIPLSILIDKYRFNLSQCLAFSINISKSPVVIHGIILMAQIIAQGLESFFSINEFPSQITSINKTITDYYVSHSDTIFHLGLNPDTMIEDVKIYSTLFDSIYNPSFSIEEREKKIIDIINDSMPHNITRASINHPAAVISMSSVFALYLKTSDMDIINTSIKQGGAASCLAFFTAVFAIS